MGRVEQELERFSPTGATARLVDALARMDGAERLPWFTSLDEAADASLGGVPDDVRVRAREGLEANRVAQALWVAQAMDTGDTGLTVFTGVRTALALFFGDGSRVALTKQQEADAAVKTLGLAFVAGRLAPDPAERDHGWASPAGRDLLRTFAVLEVAMPFWRSLSDAPVTDLLARHSSALDRWTSVLGMEGMDLARTAAGDMAERLDHEVGRVAPRVSAMAEKLRGMVPVPMRREGLGSGLAALGVDALPIYRLLCARWAVETQLMDAKAEGFRDVALPELVLPPPARFVPSAPPVPPGLLEGRPAPVDHPDGLVPLELLTGTFGRGGFWWVFTSAGVWAEGLPAHHPPAWDHHQVEGHEVHRYRFDGACLEQLDSDDVVLATHQVRRDGVDVVVDGERWARGDFDLTGFALAGTWRGEQGGTLSLSLDGRIDAAGRNGSYALGPGAIAIAWDDGEQVTLPFVAHPVPSMKEPERIYVGSVHFERRGATEDAD